MASALDLAIKDLEEKMSLQGTKDQPKENTPGWFLLRAQSLGHALLLQMRKDGYEVNPKAAEVCYKIALKKVKGNDQS